MKKLLAIILAVTMLLPVFAVNSFAASYDFSLDTFGSSGWDSSYDKSSKTITFNNGWTGRGWWIAQDGIALTDIESITINFAENTIGCQVVVSYATGTDQAFGCDAGTTSVTATFTEDPVIQVYILSHAAGTIVLDSVSVTPRTPAAEEPDDGYETVLTFVKDGKGVIDPSIDYTTACAWGSKVVSESNSAQLATLKEKMQVEGARFVLKYTISSDDGVTGGWWNFYQLNIATGATEYTMSNYQSDAAVLQDTLNGTAMENQWSLLNDGEHVVVLNCSDYISKIEAVGLSVDDIKSLGMQSGLEAGRSVYVSEWYLEAPAAEEPDDDVEVVYTNDSGLPSTDCGVTNPNDFVNIVGNHWNRGNVVNCTVEKFSEKLAEGADFVMVVSGATGNNAQLVFNGVFEKGNPVFTSTDLGNGKYELSVSLADVEDYMNANSITTVNDVCVQTWFNGFTLHEVKFVTPATPVTPVTPVTVPGFRGYIYVNEQYHAMFIGKHFIALEHIDNGTGVCPLCHAELAEADPNAEKIVYSVEKTQGQDSEGAELASGVPCIDAQGAENYFRVATNWIGGGAVWNDLASAIKTEGTIMRVTYTGTITAMVYQTEAGGYEVIEGFEVADTEDGKKVLTISCADIAAAAPVALSGDFGGWGNFIINYDGDTTLYGIEVVVPGAGGAAAAEDDIVVVE